MSDTYKGGKKENDLRIEKKKEVTKKKPKMKPFSKKDRI